MGFLDFLKKNKPLESFPTAPSRPPGIASFTSSPFDPALSGISQSASVKVEKIKPFDPAAPNPLFLPQPFSEPAAMPSLFDKPEEKPVAIPEIKPEPKPVEPLISSPTINWAQDDAVPLPPASLQSPSFLGSPTAASQPFAPQPIVSQKPMERRKPESVAPPVMHRDVQTPTAEPVAAPVQPAPDRPVTTQAPVTPTIALTYPSQPSVVGSVQSALEIPDFSEEEMAALDQMMMPSQRPLPILPEIFTKPVEAKREPKVEQPKPKLPTVKLVSELPLVEQPANVVSLPSDSITMLGEEISISRLEPAKFLSAQSYMMIVAEARFIRRTLRQGDEIVKDATLRHEQLDQQYRRAAIDINALQEHLMKIDAVLFEN